jgi:hypothetical protein
LIGLGSGAAPESTKLEDISMEMTFNDAEST